MLQSSEEVQPSLEEPLNASLGTSSDTLQLTVSAVDDDVLQKRVQQVMQDNQVRTGDMEKSNGSSHGGPSMATTACPESMNAREVADVDRTFAARVAGKLTVGGVRHSMLTLTSTALGGGLLAVSYVMEQCGLAMGIVMLVIGACVAYLSTNALMSISHEINHYTYAGLFSHCAGPRAGPVLDLMLFIYGNGSCVGYFVFLADFIPSLVELIVPHAPSWCSSRWLAIVVCAAVISPAATVKDVAALRHVAPISLLALVYVAIVIAARTPSYYHEHLHDPKYGEVVPLKFGPHLLDAFAICVFAYNCHINVVPVAGSLVRPTKARIKKVSWRVNAVQLCFYSLIGITGYLTFLDQTPQDILKGFETSDIFMAIARVLLTFTMLVAIPMNLNPSVRSGLQIWDYFNAGPALVDPSPSDSPLASPRASPPSSPQQTRPGSQQSQPVPVERPLPRIVLALVCLAFQAGLACVVPGVADVLGLLGATVATAMMLIIPAYAMSKVPVPTRFHRVQQAVLLFFALVSVSSVPVKILVMAKVMD